MKLPLHRRCFVKTLALLCCCSCYFPNNGIGVSAYRRDSLYDGSKSFFPKKLATLTAAACYTLSCLQVVTSGDECLVERFGKYHRKLEPGWHLVLKPFESVSFHVTTREQVLDVPPQQCYTLDNAPIRADAVVYMRIRDVLAARYNVQVNHFSSKHALQLFSSHPRTDSFAPSSGRHDGHPQSVSHPAT